ncbi:MAG: NAD(P)/FAD-dependent oxidoreductase [Clostridia bacterium]|nr:NAD(P)/FAD-dependent oxidoreductase [Clostridia bacterium]
MIYKEVDVAVVGGGPAGLEAAISCRDSGIKDVVILERDEHLGGILNQCIHNGFGLHWFGEELTGPEYAQKFVDQIQKSNIRYFLNTTVLEIKDDNSLMCINPDHGVFAIKPKAVILAMGCRERTRGALKIPGLRPAGIYTAGMAQKLVNLKGYLPGREVVILGSGDIGLIMARRLTWEGAKVKMVCEIMPYSTGLARNIRQCLTDYHIPLKFNHTVVDIHGHDRVTGVTVAKVDHKRQPIKDTERYIECDTLLLSVGLIPENELSQGAGIDIDTNTGGPIVDQYRHTSRPGIFACGNVLQVHDLVDYVSTEAKIAGQGAALYIKKGQHKNVNLKINPGEGIRCSVPHSITMLKPVDLYFRVDKVYTDGKIQLMNGDNILLSNEIIKAVPGEMQRITLNSDIIEQIDIYSDLELRIQQ